MIVVPELAVSSDQVVFGNEDPATVAKDLARRGAPLVQLRDIGSGDLADAPRHAAWLTLLAESSGVPVRFVGGLHQPGTIERLARTPIAALVLDACVLGEPARLRWALDLLGGRVMVELQVAGDELFPAPGRRMRAVDAVRRLHQQGLSRVLYRDLDAQELPTNLLRSLCAAAPVAVSAAVAVRSEDDVRTLAQMAPPNLESVVVGQPLFDGSLPLERAIEAAGGPGR